ncbi:MAG: MazG family protein [Lachnospiraceae bacterium]|jgi:tetrapyrrole methylase family protein/MazG family protein|nr:MazG family protein [Lachnospiraceae bacterium]
MQNKYTFEDFVKIIERLRAKDGCPWDREQTHDSLRPCMMEEAAEFVSSIRIFHESGSAENMREELGDILLQVVMHSVIAEEEGLFTLGDVIEEVSEKMIRRHPHIFGTVQVDSSDEVLENWDEIKKKEKEGKAWIASPLREIPQELPSLTRAPKVLKKIDKLYEKAPGREEVADRLREAAGKLSDCSEGTDKKETERLLGDTLLLLCEIARREKIPAEQVLMDRIEELIEEKER